MSSSLRLFLPALVFGLVAVGLLVAGLDLRPLRRGGRERRGANRPLIDLAVAAAIVFLIFAVMGFGTTEALSGLRSR